MNDVNIKIYQMIDEDLQKYVNEIIQKSLKDIDQKLNDEQLIWLCTRIFNIIKQKCKNWCWGEVERTFEMGIAGDFSTSFKLTVQSFNNWIREMSNRKAQHNRDVVNRYNPGIIDMKDKKTNLPIGAAICYHMSINIKNKTKMPDNFEIIEETAKKIKSGEIKI